MRGPSTSRGRIVVDRSIGWWTNGFVFAPIFTVGIFVFFAFTMTTAVAVDCTRVDKKQGECAFLRHTLFRKERTRASLAEIATASVVEGDDAVGIVVDPGKRPILPTDSALQHEKRTLVPRLHAFAQEETPRLQVLLGRWWQVDPELLLMVVAAFAAWIVSVRFGRFRVTLEPLENALIVEKTQWGILPTRETVPLSLVETVFVDPVDENQNKHRVRIGTVTSNVMSKERAEEIASAVAQALGEHVRGTDR